MLTPPGDDWNRRSLLAWIAVLATLWIVLAVLGYSTRDADSRLYSEIAARTAAAPVASWVAPVFPPGWFMSGAFREHPAGFFWLPAVLARVGYPAAQASYAMGALYLVLAIILLQRLAATLVPTTDARVLGWAVQLLPIAFTYRIRANHEQAILLCLVVALLGIELSRRHLAFAALSAVALVALLLVKGLFAILGPVVCGLWLLCRRAEGPRQGKARWNPWLGLVLATLAMAAAGLVYEQLYRSATGNPFWSFYLSRQLGVAKGEEIAFVTNVIWYLGRALWFPFPWPLALGALGFVALRNQIRGASPAAPGDPGARAGLAFALLTASLYVLLFSLSARKADRYIFPAYYALGAAGAMVAVRIWPPFRLLADRLHHPWVAPGVFAVTSAAHILAGWAGVPTVKIWTASP